MKAALSLAACLVLVAPAVTANPPSAKSAPAPVAPGTVRSAKAVLQEYVSAWNRHDPAALDRLLDPDSVHEDVPAGFRGKGPAEIKAFAGEVFKAQPDLKWRLTTIVESGSTVAAEWTWTSTYTGDGPNGPVKGQKISVHGATFVVVEGGRVRRFVDYYDFASAFPAPTGDAK
jgi:steroid delta-isomerase-like uncharacterized protein